MSSYIYIKNFYLEELKAITQEVINTNYIDNTTIAVELFMKNSRTFFLKFNQDLVTEELLDWLNTFRLHQTDNGRTTVIEGYHTINGVIYKYYYSNEDLYGINSKNEFYKIEDLETLVPLNNLLVTFNQTEIPEKNIHLLETIQAFQPKKKWWKFWK